MSDHHGIFTQFFLDPGVIFNSYIVLNNASKKDFTLVNNAFPSYDVAFEHLLYTTTIWLPMFTKNMIIYLQKQDIFHFNLSIVSFYPIVQSFHSNRDGDVGQ